MRLVGEYAISTATVEDSTIINGRCDLVLGYGGHARKKDISFGLVAIEVKKRYGLGTSASAQLVAYLGKPPPPPPLTPSLPQLVILQLTILPSIPVGLHQRRKAASKIVQFVYGIATDGVNFIFHRLDNDLRLQCATVLGSDKALIYRYIDIILESAIHSTPNTSPHGKFPASADIFHRQVELPLWTHPIPYAKAIVEAQDFDFVIVSDENGEPCLRRVGGRSDSACVRGGDYGTDLSVIGETSGDQEEEDEAEEE